MTQVPTYPDAGRCWQIVDKYKVSIFYTAPTAIRSMEKEGDRVSVDLVSSLFPHAFLIELRHMFVLYSALPNKGPICFATCIRQVSRESRQVCVCCVSFSSLLGASCSLLRAIWANCGQLQGCVTTVLALREGKRLAGVAKTLSLSLLRFDFHLSLLSARATIGKCRFSPLSLVMFPFFFRA